MKNASSIFRFLIDAAARGERTALVTIVNVIGGSSREPGTHMAISETGSFRGSLSGGCVEAAVVGEALRVIGRSRAELVRFGTGSPYIDIRLPCGGGIELLILPQPPILVLEAAERRLAARVPATLGMTREGGLTLMPETMTNDGQDEMFMAHHRPELRMFIIGHGAETEALTRLSVAYGADTRVLSSDATIVDTLRASGVQAWRLKTPAGSPRLSGDCNSAVVMLFHDHDWELELLVQALSQPVFFIGAMGSRATHALRLEALAERGLPPEVLARVEGPIGLIPATRDPETLAVSVLAQVVGRYEEAGRKTDAVVSPEPPPGAEV